MAFVVTAGQLRSVQNPAHQPGWGGSVPSYVQISPSLAVTYEQLFLTQPALRTVVGFLARNVAQLGIDPYRRISATDRVKASDHPVAQLLERPFPGTKLTKYRLMNTVMHDLCIYDNAYVAKIRDENGIRALLPLPARQVQPFGNNWWAAEQYRLHGPTGHVDFDADNIIHIHGYDPSDPRRGVSPIETLRQILAEEIAATSYREQLWRNGARVAGYLKRPKDAPKWSDEARRRFRRDWQAQYTGDGPATGGTPVLEDGMEFVGSGVSPRDAQYVEARKLTREEVAVAFHVPPVMMGLMEGATFSNVTEMHKSLYQETLAPYLTMIAQDLENQLLEDVDPSASNGAVYIEFNLREKMRGSFEEQAKSLQASVGAPWMTRAEARAMFNLAEVAGADELIVPLNVVAGGLASPIDTAPDAPNNGKSAPHPTVMRHYKRQRTIIAKTGRFDTDRWNRELTADLLQIKGFTPDIASATAAGINDATSSRLATMLVRNPVPSEDIRAVFDELIGESE